MTALELARAIAPLLPGTWIAVPADGHDDWADLEEQKGPVVRVRIGRTAGWAPPGKVSFLGLWPDREDGTRGWRSTPHPRVACSEKRSPKAIAGDVARRLLPAYLPAWRQALSDVRHADASKREARLAGARLAVTLGPGASSCPMDSSHDDRVRVRAGDMQVQRVIVKPAWRGRDGDYPAAVSFEVDTDPETASRIFELLREAGERPALQARVSVAPRRIPPDPQLSEQEGQRDERQEDEERGPNDLRDLRFPRGRDGEERDHEPDDPEEDREHQDEDEQVDEEGDQEGHAPDPTARLRFSAS